MDGVEGTRLMHHSDIDILVSEVGPRDGLQNTKAFMPTEYKKKWITAAAAAGLRRNQGLLF